MSVCAIGFSLFQSLALALRSHNQFPGLSLVLPPSLPPPPLLSPTWKLGNLESFKLGNWESRKLKNLATWKLGNAPPPKKKTHMEIFVHFSIGATIRIAIKFSSLLDYMDSGLSLSGAWCMNLVDVRIYFSLCPAPKPGWVMVGQNLTDKSQ